MSIAIWNKVVKIWTDGDPLVRTGQTAQLLRQMALITIALLLPRLAVSKTEIGYWEQYQYLAYLLGFAWLTGIGQSYLQRVRSLSETAADILNSKLLKLILLCTACLCSLLFLLQQPILTLLAGDANLPGWSIYLVFLLTHWPGLMYEQLLLAQKRAKRLLWFSILSNIGLLLVILLPLYLGENWFLAIRWLLLLSLLKGLFIFLDKGWCWSPKGQIDLAEKKVITQLLPAALPLVAYAGLGALIVSFDPWLVNFWYQDDQATFAVYRYGTRELPFIAAITNGIGAAVLPQFSENRSAALAQLKQSSLRLMHLFFPLAILLLLTSGWWWTMLFTPRFVESLPIFQLFLFVGVSRFFMAITPLTATGHGKALVGLGLIELLLNVLFSFWLVSQMGLIGIVWATIIAYTLDRFFAVGYLYYKESIPLTAYCNWPWLLAYTSVMIVAYTLVV